MKSCWWLYIIFAVVSEFVGESVHPSIRPFFNIIAIVCAVIGIIKLIKSPKFKHSMNTRTMSAEHKDERYSQQALLSKAYSVATESDSFGMMTFRYDTSIHTSVVEIHSMDGRQRLYTYEQLGYSTEGKAAVYFDLDVVAKFASDHGLLLINRYYNNGHIVELSDNYSRAKYNIDKNNDVFDFTVYSPQYGRKFSL